MTKQHTDFLKEIAFHHMTEMLNNKHVLIFKCVNLIVVRLS